MKKETFVNFLTDPLDRRLTLRPADVMMSEWTGGKLTYVDSTEVLPLVGLGTWFLW